MEFTISSTVFLRHLQQINSVVPTSTSLQILEHVLITVKDNQLYLKASDIDNTLSLNISLEASETEGSTTVPAKLLLDILKNIGNQNISIKTDDNFVTEITSSYGVHKIAGNNPVDFPKSIEFENESSFSIPALDFLKGINNSMYCSGQDELRPAMLGVYTQISPDGLIFVATDSHRLVKYTRKNITSTTKQAFILPKKPSQILKTILNNEQSLKIEFSTKNIRFEMEGMVLTSKLIDAKYPNFEAVIPQNNPYLLEVNRLDLFGAVKRTALFSNKNTSQIKFQIASNTLTLSAQDLDYGNAAEEKLSCAFNGEEIEIAFNAKFLIEMLSNLSSTDIEIQLSAPNRAGLITEVIENHNEETEKEHLLMLVMPVMIPSYA